MNVKRTHREAKKNSGLLMERIKTREARVAIMGMGRVGLPLAVAAANCGFRVRGIDSDPEVCKKVRLGKSSPDIDEAQLRRLVRNKRLTVSGDFRPLGKTDVVVICVPTPLRTHGELDLSYITAASKRISQNIKPPVLIILESTTYPGTTEEVVKPLLESGGKRLGKDFFLAYSPERLDPGNPRYGICNTTKIVSGADTASRKLVEAFYKSFVERTYCVGKPGIAEMAKLFENIFRGVNIALVNEMAQICSRMGLDTYEVLNAAATKEFGFMLFRPGPGVGGHCIPLDPYYLLWKSREFDLHPRFIQLAQDINENMPYYVERKLIDALNNQQKCLRGSNILLLGIAYKAGEGDTRESPAIKLFELLEKASAKVSYHDAFCPKVKISDRRVVSKMLTDDLLENSDAVVITTDHPGVDYNRVVEKSSLVLDTKYLLRDMKIPSKGKVIWL